MTDIPPPPAPPATPHPAVPPPPPHPVAPPPPPPRSRMGLIIGISLVALALVAFLLLTGMPFGGSDEPRRPNVPQTETIAEGSAAPRDPGTVIDVGGTSGTTMTDTSGIQTTTTVAPQPYPDPAAGSPSAGAAPATVFVPTPAAEPPPPRESRTPPRETSPAEPRETPRVVTRETPAREMSESESLNVVRGYITSQRYYGIESACTQLSSLGYSNRGYAIEVRDTCSGSPRLLGRWRVDTVTREVFRQRDDGRYLRP